MTIGKVRKKRGLRLLLAGAAGFNLGDNAIAAATARLLADNLPDAEITTLSTCTHSYRSEPGRTVWLDRSSPVGWSNLIREILLTDMVLLGGGTLIQDALGCGLLRGMLPYVSQLVRIARCFGKPVATVPIGVERLHSARARMLAAFVLRQSTMVLLRDEHSLELAMELLPESDRTRLVLAADPAFGLSHGISAAAESYAAVSWTRQGAQTCPETELIQVLDAAARTQLFSRLLLIPMDSRQSEEQSVFQAVMFQLPAVKEMVRLQVPADYQEASRLFRGAALVVSRRLHPMILALGYSPILSLPVADKTLGFAKEFGVMNASCSLNQGPSSLQEDIKKCSSDLGTVCVQRQYATTMQQKFGQAMDTLLEHIERVSKDKR